MMKTEKTEEKEKINMELKTGDILIFKDPTGLNMFSSDTWKHKWIKRGQRVMSFKPFGSSDSLHAVIYLGPTDGKETPEGFNSHKIAEASGSKKQIKTSFEEVGKIAQVFRHVDPTIAAQAAHQASLAADRNTAYSKPKCLSSPLFTADMQKVDEAYFKKKRDAFNKDGGEGNPMFCSEFVVSCFQSVPDAPLIPLYADVTTVSDLEHYLNYSNDFMNLGKCRVQKDDFSLLEGVPRLGSPVEHREDVKTISKKYEPELKTARERLLEFQQKSLKGLAQYRVAYSQRLIGRALGNKENDIRELEMAIAALTMNIHIEKDIKPIQEKIEKMILAYPKGHTANLGQALSIFAVTQRTKAKAEVYSVHLSDTLGKIQKDLTAYHDDTIMNDLAGLREELGLNNGSKRPSPP